MRNWMIGCSVFLILGLGVVLFLGNYLYKQAKEISSKLEKVNAEYLVLEETWPFERPDNGILALSSLERFLQCRKRMTPGLQEWTEKIEDEDRSRIEKISLTFDLYPTLGLSHAEALHAVEMSPSQYLWILNQVLVALRYAESKQAPQELKSLRASLDRFAAQFESQGADPVSDPSTREMNPLLPQIDPQQLNLPKETLDAIVASREGLEETLNLFYYFDIQFRSTFPVTLTETRAASLDKDSMEGE